MIKALIRWSIDNRILVLLVTLLISVGGIYAVRTMPVDAIPDLSDVQVIIRTSYAGQTPQTIEDQVTYPLSTAMLSVPGATAVRGYSFFGDSYVYVIFSDKTDLYWARSRVLEYLNQISDQLPAAAKPKLGPDATGVGWIYQYALVDRTGKHDLAELRSLQDWFIKYELQTLEGVSEVATVGGMVKQYQVVIDQHKLAQLNLTSQQIINRINAENINISAGKLIDGNTQYLVRTLNQFTHISQIGGLVVYRENDKIIYLNDIAEVVDGYKERTDITRINAGEAVELAIYKEGDANTVQVAKLVNDKLAAIQKTVGDNYQLTIVYDQSTFISNAISEVKFA